MSSRFAWEKWILYLLSGVDDAARWTRERIAAIKRLLENTNQYVRQVARDIYSRGLIDIIFTRPYCRIANLVDEDIAKRQTASVCFKALVEI